MSMYHDNAPLPVSADYLQHPYLNISVQNPPFVPQIQVDPWMQGYVPLIAGLAAFEVQKNAESNPLRRFFFNLFASNQFANNDFVDLVKAIVDYTVLMLVEQPHLRVENVIEQAVPDITELLVATMVKVHRGLRGYINQQGAPAIDNLIRQFDSIAAKISQFRARYGFLQHPPQAQSYQATAGYGQPAFNNGGGYHQQYPGGDPRFGNQQQQQHPQGLSMGGATVFNGGQRIQQPPPVAQGRSMSDRYADTPMPNLSTPVQSNPPQGMSQGFFNTATPESTVVSTAPEVMDGPLEPAASSKLKWKRSEHQPYHPAYNPTTHELFYQRLASGQVNAVVKQRKDTMDYDRHKLTSVFGPMPPTLDLSNIDQVMKNLNRGLDEIADEKAARVEEKLPAFKTRVRQAWYADTSLAGCWLKGAIEWANSTEDGKKPDIYRQYCQVVDAAVGLEDESPFVDSFREAETFKELKEKLDESYGDVSDSLWYKANARATAMVNRVLSFNLSLPGISIDSFTHDLDELLDVLREDCGETILKAFLSNQRHLITSIFETIGEETSENLAAELIGEMEIEGSTPKLTFLVSNISFTFLNCLSHQLSVEFAPGEPAVLLPKATPVLYQVVKDIVEEAQTFNHTVDRQLIQTLDGTILEVDVGFIGQEMFVLRLVK